MPVTHTEQRGFTLVETLVAAVVIAMALGANYLLFARSWQQHQHGVHHARAVGLARSVAESLGAARVASRADPKACSNGVASACVALASGNAVTATWRQRAGDILPAAQLGVSRRNDASLRIEVTWRDPLWPAPSRYALEVDPP